MYVNIHYIKPFEEQLKEVLGERFAEYHKGVVQGFIAGLRTTRNQLNVVLYREGAGTVDIAFEIIVYQEKFSAMIYAYPFDFITDTPQIIFPLTPINGIEISFDFSIFLKGKYSLGEGYTISWSAARRLAADFGREGIHREMKPIVAAFGKFFRKGFRFSEFAGNWVKTKDKDWL